MYDAQQVRDRVPPHTQSLIYSPANIRSGTPAGRSSERVGTDLTTRQGRLLLAVRHIAHDVVVLDVSGRSLNLRIGWVSWYVLARNVAIFLEVPPRRGDHNDIRASEYFELGGEPLKQWKACLAARLDNAPAGLTTLHSDASQAAAHLSWKRTSGPLVQLPSAEVTRFLMALWCDFLKCVPSPYRQRFGQELIAFYPEPEREEWGWLL